MLIENNRQIIVYGVAFDGVLDLERHALEGTPKEGVYVGADRQRYPCFDEEDYAYEKRCYWNFVFARSAEELRDKLERLRWMPWQTNYQKYRGDVRPVIYWEGDMREPLVALPSDDITAGKYLARKTYNSRKR